MGRPRRTAVTLISVRRAFYPRYDGHPFIEIRRENPRLQPWDESPQSLETPKSYGLSAQNAFL